MLALHDPGLRVALLNHVAVRLGDSLSEEAESVGLVREQLAHLRRLSAAELSRLAGMRSLTIEIALDTAALQAGLRHVALAREARELETYFIRHGASTALMTRLFKLPRKLTLKRRLELGARQTCGRTRLPAYALRERIHEAWVSIPDAAPRNRFFKLHQAFPHLAIAALEVVVSNFERTA